MSAPRWYVWAQGEIGTREKPGKGDNPAVVAYRKLGKMSWLKGDDSAVAWCSVFVCAALEAHGIRSTRNPLARSHATWGVPLAKPALGCIVPLWRGSPKGTLGHVGFYAGQNKDGTRIRLLGGNQGDAVSYAWVDAKRVLGYRWPKDEPLPTGGPFVVTGLPAKPVTET